MVCAKEKAVISQQWIPFRCPWPVERAEMGPSRWEPWCWESLATLSHQLLLCFTFKMLNLVFKGKLFPSAPWFQAGSHPKQQGQLPLLLLTVSKDRDSESPWPSLLPAPPHISCAACPMSILAPLFADLPSPTTWNQEPIALHHSSVPRSKQWHS